MAKEGQQAKLFEVEENEEKQALPRFSRYITEALGLLVFAFSLISLFALMGFSAGTWLIAWVEFWEKLLGWGTILLVIAWPLWVGNC